MPFIFKAHSDTFAVPKCRNRHESHLALMFQRMPSDKFTALDSGRGHGLLGGHNIERRRRGRFYSGSAVNGSE